MAEIIEAEADTVENGQEGTNTTPVPEATPAATTGVDITVEELIRIADEHFEAAETAQREGDWTTYGRELEALRQALQELMVLTEEN